MNISHPYGYPVAIALIAITLFFLIAAYREIDGLLEDRRQRRLDHTAGEETRKQLANANQQEGQPQ